MTIWLWIVGITAIIWPVIVIYFVEGHLHGRIEEVNKWSQSKLAFEFNDQSVQEKIEHLQEIIEHHDAIITAIWHKTFGFYNDEPYDAPKLAEYLGVKPKWHAHNSDWAGPVHYLVRYEPYPWGTHARDLNFPE